MSLRRLGSIVVKELRQLRRDRLTFAMIVGIPTMQLVLFGYAINLDVRHLTAAVLDQFAIVRSVTSPLGEHNFGTHYLLTGYQLSSAAPVVSDDGTVTDISSLQTVFENRFNLQYGFQPQVTAFELIETSAGSEITDPYMDLLYSNLTLNTYNANYYIVKAAYVNPPCSVQCELPVEPSCADLCAEEEQMYAAELFDKYQAVLAHPVVYPFGSQSKEAVRGDREGALGRGLQSPARRLEVVPLLLEQLGGADVATRLGKDLRRLLGVAGLEVQLARALQRLDRGDRGAERLREPEAVARVRFVHAEACMLRRCGTRAVRESLEFVRENSRNPRLVEQARERLSGLD